MLSRHCVRYLARSRGGTWPFGLVVQARAFADAPREAQLPVSEEFKKAFKQVAPLLELPKFPSSFMKHRPPVPGTIPSKVTLNFVLPYDIMIEAKEVDMVIVPATTGQMGVLPGHVPTIAELKPGILSVHEGSEVTKYFVSSGFAFIHANSFADIIAVEASPLDHFDSEEVTKGLSEYTQKLNTASTELEKAEAQIGVEVHSALSLALSA
eukprot:c34558_g1_i1 orf=607-1236(-)